MNVNGTILHLNRFDTLSRLLDRYWEYKNALQVTADTCIGPCGKSRGPLYCMNEGADGVALPFWYHATNVEAVKKALN